MTESRHAPPRSFLIPVGPGETAFLHEPAIRRYAMHWLQHAAARVHRRSERTQRLNLFARNVIGIDHLFDTSDIPSQPSRRARRSS